MTDNICTWDKEVLDKNDLISKDGYDRLSLLYEKLKRIDCWDANNIQSALSILCSKKKEKIGKWAHPLYIAVTGNEISSEIRISPGISETLALLGKDETLKRIGYCMSHIFSLRCDTIYFYTGEDAYVSTSEESK